VCIMEVVFLRIARKMSFASCKVIFQKSRNHNGCYPAEILESTCEGDKKTVHMISAAGKIKPVIEECQTGYKCDQGVCKLTDVEPSTNICTDSDLSDIDKMISDQSYIDSSVMMAGEVTYNGNPYRDRCKGPMLMEQGCRKRAVG